MVILLLFLNCCQRAKPLINREINQAVRIKHKLAGRHSRIEQAVPALFTVRPHPRQQREAHSLTQTSSSQTPKADQQNIY